MIELLTNAEMADADRRTIAGGMPGIRLMERAGEAIADAVRARFRAGSRVVVVAGPGNNGGDGFVAARLLAEGAIRSRFCWSARSTGSRAMPRWLPRRGPVQMAAEPAALAGADVIIDALFGAGLDRPVEGLPRAMIEGDERAVRLRRRGGPAERHQRYVRRRYGARRQGFPDHHVLSQEARPCASAGPALLRMRSSVADIGISDGVLAEFGPKPSRTFRSFGSRIFRARRWRAQI